MNLRKIPITLITGFLGSGKTTLCRHIVAAAESRIAFLVNEFGELAIDGKIIQGKNIVMAELGGGCVCCSLTGEFEAAVEEIVAGAAPDRIVVETTGVAEPDALAFNIGENLAGVRLDGVVTVCDADAMIRFPELGRTARMQIEAADLILLNKIDLVKPADLIEAETKLGRLNDRAAIVRTEHCRVDCDLLFGTGHRSRPGLPEHTHQPEFESFVYSTARKLDAGRFSEFAEHLDPEVYRAKGFVEFRAASKLFNFVAGRWNLEDAETPGTQLVFIGKEILRRREAILAALKDCEIQ